MIVSLFQYRLAACILFSGVCEQTSALMYEILRDLLQIQGVKCIVSDVVQLRTSPPSDFARGYSGYGLKLTTRFNLVPTLRMSGTVPLLLLYPFVSRQAQIDFTRM